MARKKQLIEEFDPESFPGRKRKRIHGGYLGRKKYKQMLEEAEPPRTKRQIEQARIRRKKKREEGE